LQQQRLILVAFFARKAVWVQLRHL
jgi:hypothetical protein